MAIVLTQEEQDYLDKCFNGYSVDETYATPVEGVNESISWCDLPTGRKVHMIYHHASDNITVFAVDEAPIPAPMVKLADFLSKNPDVKELLGL
jgi:hypothetical protein